jgi:hypothetical protein
MIAIIMAIMPPTEIFRPRPDDLNPVHWQRHYEEGAYRLAEDAAKIGFPDKELFVTGYALNQISGDDFNIVGHYESIDKIKEYHLEKGEVRRAQLLGRMSFELSRPDIPDSIKAELEKVQTFIGFTPWNNVINLWKSHQAFKSFHNFFDGQKNDPAIGVAYSYAMEAQIAFVTSGL